MRLKNKYKLERAINDMNGFPGWVLFKLDYNGNVAAEIGWGRKKELEKICASLKKKDFKCSDYYINNLEHQKED